MMEYKKRKDGVIVPTDDTHYKLLLANRKSLSLEKKIEEILKRLEQ